jgi:hypothetical protein
MTPDEGREKNCRRKTPESAEKVKEGIDDQLAGEIAEERNWEVVLFGLISHDVQWRG